MDLTPVLTRTRIHAGVWEGVLTLPGGSGATPSVTVTHQGEALPDVTLTADPDQADRYLLRIPIPADLLSDGVQSFVIADTASGARLGSFAIVTGEPLEHDLRAEIDLLRAELDLLKKAFRRHCLETR